MRKAPPYSVVLRVTRDQDGDVTVTWNGKSPDTGNVTGDVDSIAVTLTKSVKAPLGRSTRVEQLLQKNTNILKAKPLPKLSVLEKNTNAGLR